MQRHEYSFQRQATSPINPPHRVGVLPHRHQISTPQHLYEKRDYYCRSPSEAVPSHFQNNEIYSHYPHAQYEGYHNNHRKEERHHSHATIAQRPRRYEETSYSFHDSRKAVHGMRGDPPEYWEAHSHERRLERKRLSSSDYSHSFRSTEREYYADGRSQMRYRPDGPERTSAHNSEWDRRRGDHSHLPYIPHAPFESSFDQPTIHRTKPSSIEEMTPTLNVVSEEEDRGSRPPSVPSLESSECSPVRNSESRDFRVQEDGGTKQRAIENSTKIEFEEVSTGGQKLDFLAALATSRLETLCSTGHNTGKENIIQKKRKTNQLGTTLESTDSKVENGVQSKISHVAANQKDSTVVSSQCMVHSCERSSVPHQFEQQYRPRQFHSPTAPEYDSYSYFDEQKLSSHRRSHIPFSTVQMNSQPLSNAHHFQQPRTNKRPFSQTQNVPLKSTSTVSLHKLPKGLTYRKVCSHCGRQRAEHGEFGFGNKCPFTSCGRCGASVECHQKKQMQMGVTCTLLECDGAHSGASRKYDLMLADLAARAEIRVELGKKEIGGKK